MKKYTDRKLLKKYQKLEKELKDKHLEYDRARDTLNNSTSFDLIGKWFKEDCQDNIYYQIVDIDSKYDTKIVFNVHTFINNGEIESTFNLKRSLNDLFNLIELSEIKADIVSKATVNEKKHYSYNEMMNLLIQYKTKKFRRVMWTDNIPDFTNKSTISNLNRTDANAMDWYEIN